MSASGSLPQKIEGLENRTYSLFDLKSSYASILAKLFSFEETS